MQIVIMPFALELFAALAWIPDRRPHRLPLASCSPFCIGNINVVAFARHLYAISARLKLITQEKKPADSAHIPQGRMLYQRFRCDLRLCLGGTGTKRLGVVVPVALVPRIDHDKPHASCG
ncbi:MAG: hypothetical protein ACLR8L_16200 [Oscillospiraceae bacterium]